MAERIERVRDRIRKLLRLAENDAASEGEVENALRFAQALMDEHHVAADDLRREQDRDDLRSEMNTVDGWSNSAKRSAWESYLAQAIVTTLGTVGYYWRGGGAREVKTDAGILRRDGNGRTLKRVAMVWYGPAEDIALARELFQDLSQTIASMARLKYGGVFRGPGRSYAEGFASSLLDLARKGDGDRTAATGAIVRRTAALAKSWLREERGVRLVSGGAMGGGRQHSGAHAAGRADGRSHGWNARRRSKLTSGPKRLTGS